MRNGKRVMLWLCVGCLCLPAGLAAIPERKVQAEDGESIITNEILETENWRYKYEGTDDDPEVTIVEYTGEAAEVTVPAQFDGYPVTRIEGGAFKESSVTAVELPKSVYEIRDEAFYGCGSLETVTISGSGSARETTEKPMLGARAFANCTSLCHVELPEATTRICTNAFSGCTALEQIDIPEAVAQLDDSVFYGCTSLSEILLPEGVHTLQSFAFQGCSSLQSVRLSPSLTLIDSSVFEACTSLKSIVIPEGVEEIDFEAFKDCTNLEIAVIPDSVMTIRFDAFENCNKLTIYAEKESVALAFADDENRHLKGGIPVKSATAAVSENSAGWMYMDLGEEAEIVGYTGALKQLEVPAELGGQQVTSMAGRIFKGKDIIGVTLPDSIVSIGEDIFRDNAELKTVALSDSLTSLGDYAFSGCAQLESITFPSKITYIGNYAFNECSKLQTAEFAKRSGEGTEEIFLGYDAFRKCDLQSIELPAGVKDILEYTFYDNANMTAAILPEGIQSIGESAFSGCAKLTGITIPSSVTYIWDDAFWGCIALSEITIPANVTTIENGAFYYCPALKKATILSNVKTIKTTAFGACEQLTIYTTKGSAAETYAKNNEIPVVLLDGASDDSGNSENSGKAESDADKTGGSVTGDANTGAAEGTKDKSTDETTGGSGQNQDATVKNPDNTVKVPSVAKVKKLKVTAKKKAITVTWKKAAGVNGYQIQVSTKKNFKGAKTTAIKKTKVKYTASKLKSKKKYYIRIRAYKTYKDAAGKTQKAYGKWVTVNIKTK
ncbi:MAG: leucine-rich repeat domain-containing protein [Lachnospiraceae bacterium]|nr:leucine-rich repeat domain-containing protein [Lachnospiraceae bacterium]